MGFAIGDLVVVNYHRHYEPGRIIAVVESTDAAGQSEALYRIDFGRFTLHLAADEITHDDGTGVDTRVRPGWLMNLFCYLLTQGEAHDSRGQVVDPRWLTGRFYSHGDPLPAQVCREAGLAPGTTYAQAARWLRRTGG